MKYTDTKQCKECGETFTRPDSYTNNNVSTYTKGTGGYSAVYVSPTAGPSGSPTWAAYGTTF